MKGDVYNVLNIFVYLLAYHCQL